MTFVYFRKDTDKHKKTHDFMKVGIYSEQVQNKY